MFHLFGNCLVTEKESLSSQQYFVIPQPPQTRLEIFNLHSNYWQNHKILIFKSEQGQIFVKCKVGDVLTDGYYNEID